MDYGKLQNVVIFEKKCYMNIWLLPVGSCTDIAEKIELRDMQGFSGGSQNSDSFEHISPSRSEQKQALAGISERKPI